MNGYVQHVLSFENDISSLNKRYDVIIKIINKFAIRKSENTSYKGFKSYHFFAECKCANPVTAIGIHYYLRN